jgi:hypothetical protein
MRSRVPLGDESRAFDEDVGAGAERSKRMFGFRDELL